MSLQSSPQDNGPEKLNAPTSVEIGTPALPPGGRPHPKPSSHSSSSESGGSSSDEDEEDSHAEREATDQSMWSRYRRCLLVRELTLPGAA
eukprot:s499_g16.t2